MKTISLYDVTVPVFVKQLTNMSVILDKAEAFAKERGFEADMFVQDRLAVDQYPLVRQVQIACDNAKSATARLAGMEPPKMEDNETTLAELKARIAKTLEFIQSVKPEEIDGKEGAPIPIFFAPGKILPGIEYALQFILPNFFFHCATAYDIIRKNGVAIGKMDYIGQINLQDAPAAK